MALGVYLDRVKHDFTYLMMFGIATLLFGVCICVMLVRRRRRERLDAGLPVRQLRRRTVPTVSVR